MRLILLTVLLAALAAAPAASAKGPSAAHITGPGASIRLQGDEGAPGAFWTIVEGLGFFPAAFGQQPSPMLAARPSGDLGARYAVRWTVPGPSGARQIEQSLYPYAAGGPVTFMPAGQRVFSTQVTRGGWFRGTAAARRALVERGIPATQPGGSSRLPRVALLVIVILAGALVIAGLMRIRRRPEPRTA